MWLHFQTTFLHLKYTKEKKRLLNAIRTKIKPQTHHKFRWTYTIMKRIDIRVHHLWGVCWFHQLKPQNPLLLHVFPLSKRLVSPLCAWGLISIIHSRHYPMAFCEIFKFSLQNCWFIKVLVNYRKDMVINN